MEEFTKYDDEKTRPELIPPHALEAVADVLGYGARKYDDENWRRGGTDAIPRYMGAALRHIMAYMRGEVEDQESGRHHLAHAITSLMFVMELEVEEE